MIRRGPVEDVDVVVIHPEHEAAVHHHPVVVQAAHREGVVPSEILLLALADQVRIGERLESDEQAAQSGRGGSLDLLLNERSTRPFAI